MGRLKQFYHEALSDDDEAGLEPEMPVEELARALETGVEDIERAMTLLNGVESHTDVSEASVAILPELSLEGFPEVIQSIWERLKRWVKETMNMMVSENKVGQVTARLIQFQAENLKMQSRAILNRPSRRVASRFSMQSYVTALSVFYKTPTKAGDVIAGLRNLDRVLDEHYTYVDQRLLPIIKRVTSEIRTLDPSQDKFPGDLVKITGILADASPVNALKAMYSDATAGLVMGSHLMGNQRLAGRPIPDDPRLRDVLQSGVFLKHSENTPRAMPNSYQLPHFGILSNDQALNEVVKISKKINHTLSASITASRSRAVADLTNAVDGLVVKAKQNDALTPDTRELVEQVARTPKALSRWLRGPTQGLTTNALRSLKGTLVMCRNNLE